MGVFRTGGYDRARLLDAATRARARNRRGTAIRLYRWLLAVEPKNVEYHAKLAPLLAETGQHFDAWLSFRAIANACLREGQLDRALAVYREAARHLPRECQAWQAIARIEQRRGREEEAVEVLREGSRHFRPRWLRPQAIHLLRRAREIRPWDFETVSELGRLLASTDQLEEAIALLGGLARRSQGERLRRARGLLFRVAPTPGRAWRWLRAALGREEAEAELVPGRSSVVPLRAARQR